MKIWKNCVLFYTGGAAYLTLELLYRGRSHGSMFAAGGLCFLLIGQLGRVRPRLPIPVQALVGSMIVTAVELGAGLLVNRNHAVCDYRDQPGNFLGQICPVFSALWIPLSLVAIGLYHLLDKKIPTAVVKR